MRLPYVLALTLVVVAASRSSAASELDVRGSREGFDTKRLDELIALELGASSDPERIVVRLDGDRAVVELTLRGAERTRTGAVDLAGARDVERAVALFVGELSRSSDEPSEPPRALPPPRDEAPRASPPAAPDALSLYGSATMGARWLTSRGASILTPRLEAGASLGRALHVGLVARYGYASESDALGSVRAHLASGGLAATYDPIAQDAFALGTGPRVELGWAFGHGEGVGASSASDYTFAPAWEIDARLRIAGALFVTVASEVGWLGRGLDLHADDRTVLTLHGLFAGASAGLALLPRTHD